MAIIGGFDVHRKQSGFDCLDTATGEVTAGQIRPPTLWGGAGLARPL